MTDAQSSAALLPCPNPWCEADERDGDFKPQVQYSNFGMVYVACTSCTMAGPTRQHEVDAITAWNTRPTPTPSDQAGWQDIATAPRDGTAILAYRDDAGVFTAHYVEADAHISSMINPPEGDCYWFTTGGEDLTGDMFTHWMPLPTAPTITAGEGGGE